MIRMDRFGLWIGRTGGSIEMSRENPRGTWRTIRRLERSIPQIKWYRTELVLMSTFVNIFALGLPIFILQVYDRVLPNLGLTTMQFLVVGLIAVMLLDFFLKTARASVTTYTGARFEHLARVSAVDHILRTPQDVYESDTPGVYLDKVNAIGVVKDFYSSQIGTLMIDLPFAIFFLGMIWFLGGIMVAVPLGLLCLFGIMAALVGSNLRKAVDNRSQVDNRRYDFLIEIINGIHTVKAQAFKNLLQRRFDPLQEMSARAVRSVAMQSSIAQSLGSTFGQLNMACVIGTGAVLVIDGALSAGELAACTLLSGRAMQPLQSAMGLWTNFQTIRVACDNAVSVLELPAEDLRNMPDMPKILGDLEFRDVTFGYAGMDEPLIKNLTLNVKAGEMIGIEGENSSGRSTLLKLMIGLIRPTHGQVLLDGHDLAKHKSQSYRKQMAFLSADADVYSGTILDNMTYFRGGKYIGKAIKIAKQLGIDEEIKRLPEGYGTQVGDGAGGILPAGFIQRITIIRAMVDDPKVVLFDNANNGLDSNSDNTLMEYMRSLHGKATVILVTSRPSWLRMADHRYVMTDGDLQVKTAEEQPAQPAPALPKPTPAPTPSEPSPAPKQAAPEPASAPKPSPVAAPIAKPVEKTENKGPKISTPPKPVAKPIAKPAAKPSAAPVVKPAASSPKTGPKISAAPARPAQNAKPTAAPAAKPAAPQVQKSGPKISQPARKPTTVAKPAPKLVPSAPALQPKPAAVRNVAPAVKPAPKPPVPAPKAEQKPATRQTADTQPAQQAKPTPTRKVQPRSNPVSATPQRAPEPKPAPPKAAEKPAPTKTASAKFKAAPTPAPSPRPQPAPMPSVLKETDSAIENTPATAPKKSTARFTPKPKPAPKPLATLRAAPNAETTIAPKRATAVMKPVPPKPQQSTVKRQSAGGAE